MTKAEAAFVNNRELLFTVAYEMLGTAADAEDVVQESWLRWVGVDHEKVNDPRAYLVRIVTRGALNRLRTIKRQRETYIGPWLPEPVVTTNIAEDVELAESVSFAMLVVLETLAPVERAVFVLREVFNFGYDEIAEAVDKSNAAVRQIAHRAREHVRSRRAQSGVAGELHAEVSERFFEASLSGDVQVLMDVLAPGVVLLTDGGGKANAARKPIIGVEKVLRFFDGVRPAPERMNAVPVWVNGRRSVMVYLDGILDTVIGTHVQDGIITEIYVMRNPEKLVRMTGPATRLVR